MKIDPVVQYLWDFGYFFSPMAQVIDEVNEDDLSFLSLEDTVCSEALRAYQDFFYDDINDGCQRLHGRKATVDGVVGPATLEVMAQPRCGHPDYYRAGEEPEQARFPDSCKNRITTSYKMSLSGISDDDLKRLWIEADKNWSDVLDLDFVLELDKYPKTNIFAFEAALGGSILADQYLANGSCGARLRGRYDNRRWSELLLVSTITHEHGHGLGLGHLNDRDAVMYPSIHQASMQRRGKPNSSDINAMLRIGYERRATPPSPPDPPPTPDDPKTELLFKWNRGGHTFGVYEIGKDDNGGGYGF